MRILVIGSEGFIGRFLSRRLINSGYEVVGMDINPPESKENSYYFVLGNIFNPKDIMRAAEGVDAIIHLVAKHHDFGISREEFFRVNGKGTDNLLNCATKLGINKFIFYSTVAVYGDINVPATEENILCPVSDYGQSKLAAEKIIQKWVEESSNRHAVILRPTVVFGPYNYANMYNLIDNIYKKRFLFVGKGENIKSVAYVENLVDATIFIIENLKPGLEIYNYSDYPQMTSTQIAETIANCLSCSIPKFRIPLGFAVTIGSIFDLLGRITGYNFSITAKRMKKFNNPTHFVSDKIRTAGFSPSVNLSEGFRRMVEWYLNNNGSKVFPKSRESDVEKGTTELHATSKRSGGGNGSY